MNGFSMAFILFIGFSFVTMAFIVGYLVGFDSDKETNRDIFRHYATEEEAYKQGLLVGWDKGWESCANTCIERMKWNSDDYMQKHKDDILELIRNGVIE